MNPAVAVTLIVVGLILLGSLAVISSHNKFARQRNTIEESWRQVDVELQRRHDLIGNLVEVTSAAARFEQATLLRVTQARAQAMAAHGAGPVAQGRAEQALNGALANFFQVAEAYPNLSANQDFRYLQEQMVECEDRLAAGRRFYNGNVRAYNTRLDTFPSNLVAGLGKFDKQEYYEVDDPRVRAAPSLRGAFDGLSDGLSNSVTPTPAMGNPMAPGQLPPTPPPAQG